LVRRLQAAYAKLKSLEARSQEPDKVSVPSARGGKAREAAVATAREAQEKMLPLIQRRMRLQGLKDELEAAIRDNEALPEQHPDAPPMQETQAHKRLLALHRELQVTLNGIDDAQRTLEGLDELIGVARSVGQDKLPNPSKASEQEVAKARESYGEALLAHDEQ
jgi:hypothetical protein